jgi:hypothetical protein
MDPQLLQRRRRQPENVANFSFCFVASFLPFRHLLRLTSCVLHLQLTHRPPCRVAARSAGGATHLLAQSARSLCSASDSRARPSFCSCLTPVLCACHLPRSSTTSTEGSVTTGTVQTEPGRAMAKWQEDAVLVTSRSSSSARTLLSTMLARRGIALFVRTARGDGISRPFQRPP